MFYSTLIFIVASD
ncbi:hypothetical protein SPV_2479 [Streptococcus pneumoniae]|nr:hypothetical protein SPV_2479 [Streptococcus pneumoniae]